MITIRDGLLNTQTGGGGISHKLCVSSIPSKLYYKEGEALDTSGASFLFKNISENTSEVVSELKSTPANGSVLTRDNKYIEFEYENNGLSYSASIPISVKFPVSLKINFLPKGSYKKTETINISGIIASLVYNDGSEELIEDYGTLTTTPAIGELFDGNRLLKIHYNKDNISLTTTYELNRNVEIIGAIDPRIVTFASGSWEAIGAMLERHKNGEINIADYWKVGDVRKLYDFNGTHYGSLVIYSINGILEDGTRYNVAIGRKELLGERPNGVNSDKYAIYKDVMAPFDFTLYSENIFSGNRWMIMYSSDAPNYKDADTYLDKYIDGKYKKISMYYNYKEYDNYYKNVDGRTIMSCIGNSKTANTKDIDFAKNMILYNFVLYGSNRYIYHGSLKPNSDGTVDLVYNTEKINMLNLNKFIIPFDVYEDCYVGNYFADHSNDNLSPTYKYYESGYNSSYYYAFRIFNKIKYKYYKKRININNHNKIYSMTHSILLSLHEENMFGDNAFEYFKTAQNRIFTYHGVPAKYMLPNCAIDETIFDNKEYELQISGKYYDLQSINSGQNDIKLIPKDAIIHKSGHKTITKMPKIVDENGSLVDVLAGIKRYDATQEEIKNHTASLYKKIVFGYEGGSYCLSPQCFFL